jgi:DNA-binding NtrC family response regulator
MPATRALVKQVAGADVAVRIQGESGSGKEVLAELIHRRRARPTTRCSSSSARACPTIRG